MKDKQDPLPSQMDQRLKARAECYQRDTIQFPYKSIPFILCMCVCVCVCVCEREREREREREAGWGGGRSQEEVVKEKKEFTSSSIGL